MSGLTFLSSPSDRAVIRTSQFIKKIRSLDYTYKTRQKRTELWRKKGGTHYISVPMRDFLEEEFVISSLRQAKCSLDEIKTFLASCNI
jgi:hypothetical protein